MHTLRKGTNTFHENCFLKKTKVIKTWFSDTNKEFWENLRNFRACIKKYQNLVVWALVFTPFLTALHAGILASHKWRMTYLFAVVWNKGIHLYRIFAVIRIIWNQNKGTNSEMLSGCKALLNGEYHQDNSKRLMKFWNEIQVSVQKLSVSFSY